MCRSNVLPGDDPLIRNLSIDHTTMPSIIKSLQETFADDDTVSTTDSTIPEHECYQATDSMHVIETSDLVGRSFLVITPEDNQRLRLKIVNALDSHQDGLNYDPTLKEFIVTSKDETIEEIMSYN